MMQDDDHAVEQATKARHRLSSIFAIILLMSAVHLTAMTVCSLGVDQEGFQLAAKILAHPAYLLRRIDYLPEFVQLAFMCMNPLLWGAAAGFLITCIWPKPFKNRDVNNGRR